MADAHEPCKPVSCDAHSVNAQLGKLWAQEDYDQSCDKSILSQQQILDQWVCHNFQYVPPHQG